MHRLFRSSLLTAVAAVGLVAFRSPSDQIGVYGVIDKVVLAPNATDPTTIQLWGSFAISEQMGGDHYRPALKGYLYLRLDPSNERATRAEWADMQKLAGTGKIVGFGAKYAKAGPLRVRCATESVAAPDDYQVNMGLVTAVGAQLGNSTSAEITADLLSGKASPALCKK